VIRHDLILAEFKIRQRGAQIFSDFFCLIFDSVKTGRSVGRKYWDLAVQESKTDQTPKNGN